MSRRILVVDDDGLVLRSVAKVLSRAGYDVLTAVDVESALRHTESGSIDAAIVDYALSRETGLAVLSRMREVHPRCVRMLITGRSDSSVIVEAVNRGEVVKVLRKPFEGPHLLKELEEAFASAQRMEKVTTTLRGEEAEADRLALEQVMRQAQMRLAVQPILEIDGSEQPRAFAYECLLRPRNERLSSPLLLLHAAERHDRIHELGSAVLAMSQGWLAQIRSPTRMFVNLHPLQLQQPDRLRADLMAFGPQSGRVVLEITEQSRLQDIDRWEESVAVIEQLGFAIAVDDLGAGYSSLSILADLQPQFIKLDMSLVRNVHREPRKQRLVSLMRSFGEATDARVIAEGVEFAEEAAALVDCGIQLMQGYHYARPSETLLAQVA